MPNPSPSGGSPLRPREEIVYQPTSLDGEALEVAARDKVVPAPKLPEIAEIQSFLDLAKKTVELPNSNSNQSVQDPDVLRLDDILAEPTVISPADFPRLLSDGLSLLRSIDPRFLNPRPTKTPPFSKLKDLSELGKEVLGSLRTLERMCTRVYTSTPNEVLTRAMAGILHHLGPSHDLRTTSRDVAQRLVALEMCWDAGVQPVMPAPDATTFGRTVGGAGASQKSERSTSSGEPPVRQRKPLNYGRPTKTDGAASGDDFTSEQQGTSSKSEPTRAELVRMRDENGAQELSQHLLQGEIDSHREFLARVRRSRKIFESYGPLKISEYEAKSRGEGDAVRTLENELPAWLGHAMQVSASGIEDRPSRPYLQTVAEQVTHSTGQILTFLEKVKGGLYTEEETQKLSTEKIAQLSTRVIKMYAAYNKVIELMEAVAPVARDAGLFNAVPQEDAKILASLAPSVSPPSQELSPIFERYGESRRRAAENMKIELLARRLSINGVDTEIARHPVGTEGRHACARRIAARQLGLELPE